MNHHGDIKRLDISLQRNDCNVNVNPFVYRQPEKHAFVGRLASDGAKEMETKSQTVMVSGVAQ